MDIRRGDWGRRLGTFGSEGVSSVVRLFILACIRQTPIADSEDNPDISPFPYPDIAPLLPQAQANRGLSHHVIFQPELNFLSEQTFDPTVQIPPSGVSLRRKLNGSGANSREKKLFRKLIDQQPTRCSRAASISPICLYFVHHCVLPRLFFMSACATISLTPTHFTLVP